MEGGGGGGLLSKRCGVERREISPSRMSTWPCRTGRMRFCLVGAGVVGGCFSSAGAFCVEAAAVGGGWCGVGWEVLRRLLLRVFCVDDRDADFLWDMFVAERVRGSAEVVTFRCFGFGCKGCMNVCCCAGGSGTRGG